MKTTTFANFTELAQSGNFVPVYKEIMADLLTPVSAFLKIAEHSDYAFLLESVEGAEKIARYSFLGKDPFLVLRRKGGKTLLERAGSTIESDEPFIPKLRTLMAEFRSPVVPDLPRFTGGAVGYIGYNASTWFEPTLEKCEERFSQELSEEDDAIFMLFDTVLAFDHLKHRILIISNARISDGEELEPLYQFSCAKLAFLERELERALSSPELVKHSPLEIGSNLTREDFEAGVEKAKRYISEGDIFQVVLSQRFEVDIAVDPFTVYRALRHVNPSPYMYFTRMGSLSIVGSSPEMLVRVEGRRVETHPIAGTRPRGKNENEDSSLASELSGNEKERAEHVMLVDLGRNDIGRVSEFGSVKVLQYAGLERYSHVMHLVSRVEGQLDQDHDRLDALVACFPAGTVSGAPKIRAMEIITELESTRRGIYAGAIGYLDFAGNLDFCIAIRTIVIRDGRAFFQAGAGIVADSDPRAEFNETCDKASALVRALELSQHKW